MRIEKKHNAARWFFMSALWPLIPAELYWVCTTQESLTMRVAVAVVIGGMAGASFIIGAGESLRYIITGARAQQTQESNIEKQNNSGDNIVGAQIIGNNQGGDAAKIESTGTPERPSNGANIDVTAPPGHSVTGLHVEQNGPGTGLRVIQTGPGTGLNVRVQVGPPSSQQ